MVAEHRVIADFGDGQGRLTITERSTVALEPLKLEFETIEDAAEYVTIHPELFSSDVYAALLERLEGLGGGDL